MKIDGGEPLRPFDPLLPLESIGHLEIKTPDVPKLRIEVEEIELMAKGVKMWGGTAREFIDSFSELIFIDDRGETKYVKEGLSCFNRLKAELERLLLRLRRCSSPLKRSR